MTNKEILQADLLDILFEHRNKLYGAYALRKNYKHRLGLALGTALSTVLLFIMMSFMNKKEKGGHNIKNDDVVKLIDLVIPDEPKEPEPPREKPRPLTASVDYQPPIITKDELVTEVLPDIDDITDADVSNKNQDGQKPNDIANVKPESERNGEAQVKETEKADEPVLPGHGPIFPGGTEAWLAFLQRNLQSPEDLEPGQRVEVLVRFWVDVDGKISRPEVVKSGGSSFDREVLRVLKKMPRWEPALQAGNPIAVAYSQPVIFIGVEQ